VELLKDTPLEVAWRVWQARPPQPSLTVVVKGTFELVKDGQCPFAKDQALVTGDEHVDQDPERSLRYPNDLEPLKPRGECFVIGSFFAPGGRPVGQARATFQIGPVKKHIEVFGPRYWALGRPTDPIPVAKVELSWENAFGGTKDNPCGKGVEKVAIDGREVVPLPQIEDPARLITSRDSRPAAVATGPIARTWPARLELAGTYDALWQRERYPWFPEDIDWEHFNAAPRDQRIGGFFAGDEEIRLVNLHEEHAQLACKLPGALPRALLVPAKGAPRELAFRLDTITVDTDAGHAIVVWRAITEVARGDLSDVAQLYVTHDLNLDPRGDAALLDAWSEKLAADQRGDAFEPEPVPEVAAEVPGAKWAHLDQAMTVRGDDAAVAAALAMAVARRQASGGLLAPVFNDALGLGAPAMSLDRELSPEEKLELEMQLALGDLTKQPSSDLRERVKRRVAAGESLAGEDLTGADLSGLSLRNADFEKAILTRANFSGANIVDADFDGATFTEAELSDGFFQGCSFEKADLTGARAERARFEDSRVDRAFFSKCFLRDARFARSFFKRTEIAESDLTGASFRECNLDESDFTGSMLDGATFSECTLKDAWLDAIKAQRARFDGCDATLLRAGEGADLDGASFKKTVLDGARFSTARFRGANFSLARLARADFSGAFLMEASLIGCDLRKARFDGATLLRASLLKANLMQARLEGADLRFCDLRGANLFQAELLDANLDDARLDLVDLSTTRRG
jgi:uncharacterized protein YjbI with pentapeptide repeats